MYDIGLDASLSKPAGQPETIAPRFIGGDNTLDLPSCRDGFIPPTTNEFQQFIFVGLHLLQRLALEAWNHSCDQPV